MKKINAVKTVSLILLAISMTTLSIFDFTSDSSLDNWRTVNDGVMGGLSRSTFTITDAGHGKFSGTVSLENNGGFASLRHYLEPQKVSADATITLRVKGDGKNYQFRIKENSRQYFSYITTFETTGEWQEIIIPLAELYPSFRGRKLSHPNFNHDSIEELVFLIGNKKAEDFQLLIDWIKLNN